MRRLEPERLENIVEKEENADFKHSNPFPKNKFFSILKEYADDKFKCDENDRKFF